MRQNQNRILFRTGLCVALPAAFAGIVAWALMRMLQPQHVLELLRAWSAC